MMIIFPSLHPERFMWQVLMFPCVMGGLQQYIIFMSRIEYSHTTDYTATLLPPPVSSLMTALTSSLEIMISPHTNVLLARQV